MRGPAWIQGPELGRGMPYWVNKHPSGHRHVQKGMVVIKNEWLWMPNKELGLCLELYLEIGLISVYKVIIYYLMFCKQRHTHLAMNPFFERIDFLSHIIRIVKQGQNLELRRPGFEFCDCHLLTLNLHFFLRIVLHSYRGWGGAIIMISHVHFLPTPVW